MSVKGYPTLTALMTGREPGSVKVRRYDWPEHVAARPFVWMPRKASWMLVRLDGADLRVDDDGPWFLVSEDAPAPDTLRLEIATKLLASLLSRGPQAEPWWPTRHAWALAEADALIEEARK